MFPVVVLGIIQGIPLGRHSVDEANHLWRPLSVLPLINGYDGLWGHVAVDEVRLGPGGPNAAPSLDRERHADDDALVVLGSLVVRLGVVGIGESSGPLVPGVFRAGVRKHAARLETSPRDSLTDREASSMVQESKAETIPDEGPVHSFRDHFPGQPSISAVPELRSAREDAILPNEHINTLLGAPTARECDSEKSCDASVAGVDVSLIARHGLPSVVGVYLLSEVWHVKSSILVLWKKASLVIVSMPKQATESLAEAYAV